MVEKLEQILKNKNVVIPGVLFYNYRNLGMTAEDVILLSYLLESDNRFNPKKISQDMSMPLGELMDSIEHLKELDIIKIELKKVGNVRAEVINLEGFYNRLTNLLMDNNKKKDMTEIFNIFEKEFARTLSPIEYEIINAWQDSNILEETIILALKEAVYNGVTNLRYIDKILNEWSKKGIKTKEDLEKSRKKINIVKEDIPDIDYDWLNDEE